MTAFRCGVLFAMLVLLSMSETGFAREEATPVATQSIEDLKQQNLGSGPGCDSIGIAIPPADNLPAEISPRWAAGHSACAPGIRLTMACTGAVIGDDRIIGCTVQVTAGSQSGTIGCDQFTLIAPSARFGPDPALSDALSRGTDNDDSQSCSDSSNLSGGTTIAFAFMVPADGSTGDLAVAVDGIGGKRLMFLIPAGQLGATADRAS